MAENWLKIFNFIFLIASNKPISFFLSIYLPLLIFALLNGDFNFNSLYFQKVEDKFFYNVLYIHPFLGICLILRIYPTGKKNSFSGALDKSSTKYSFCVFEFLEFIGKINL